MGMSLRIARALLLAAIAAVSLHFLDARGLGWGVAGLIFLLALFNELSRWIVLIVGGLAIWSIAHLTFSLPGPQELIKGQDAPGRTAPQRPDEAAEGTALGGEVTQRLADLQAARDQNLITPEEHARLRAGVLDQVAEGDAP